MAIDLPRRFVKQRLYRKVVKEVGGGTTEVLSTGGDAHLGACAD